MCKVYSYSSYDTYVKIYNINYQTSIIRKTEICYGEQENDKLYHRSIFHCVDIFDVCSHDDSRFYIRFGNWYVLVDTHMDITIWFFDENVSICLHINAILI